MTEAAAGIRPRRTPTDVLQALVGCRCWKIRFSSWRQAQATRPEEEDEWKQRPGNGGSKDSGGNTRQPWTCTRRRESAKGPAIAGLRSGGGRHQAGHVLGHYSCYPETAPTRGAVRRRTGLARPKRRAASRLVRDSFGEWWKTLGFER